MATERDLAGRRVLVTGASSGIGAATALAFARHGAVVGVCARRPDRLQATVDGCEALGTRAHGWVVDLSDLRGIDAFARQVVVELGGVDILVNNAGAGRRRRMQDISVADFDATMALNFGAPMRLTLALLPQMLERGSGRIVSIGSSGTREFAPGTGAYVAAKAALDAFTEALYIDLAGTGVSAHSFVPGRTATEFSAARPDQDPPFPADPANTDSAADVAEAIVASLTTEGFEHFANPEVAARAAEKRGDVNGYLAKRRNWMSRREDQ